MELKYMGAHREHMGELVYKGKTGKRLGGLLHNVMVGVV